jgi:8-oxo-dGTP diphosphatase
MIRVRVWFFSTLTRRLANEGQYLYYMRQGIVVKLGTLCYVEHDDKYLMLHRVKKTDDIHKGLWVGLGGKFEAGESPEECVIREVFEESGLKITQPVLRGILTFPSDAFNQDDWYVFLFTADSYTGVLKKSEEGELAWVDKEKLEDYPMHKGDLYFLKWIQENKGIFSAKYIYENGVLKNFQTIGYCNE